jgi:hypothetical protein
LPGFFYDNSTQKIAMKKTFAAVVTSLALIAAPAFAQGPAVVDPAAAAAVKDLLASMRYREVMAASLLQMERSMPQQFRMTVAAQLDANPKLSADDKAKALAELEKTIPGVVATMHTFLSDPVLMDELTAEMVPLYANLFTVAELRELAAFYRQPLGQKMLATMPKVMGESMQISNRVMGPRMNKLMQQVMQSVANPK